MKDLDILYYDYMIESVEANRKINEALFGLEFAEKINESSLVMEASAMDSIKEFFKKIFDKMIEFFTKIINFIKGDRFKPNEKLIKACEEKLKNTNSKDSVNFKLEKANPAKITDKCYITSFEIFTTYRNTLNKFMEQITNKFNIGEINYFSPEDIKESEKLLEENLVSNINKDKFEDVSFNDIHTILNKYKNKKIEDINKEIQNTNKQIQSYKQKMNLVYKLEYANTNILKEAKTFVSSASSLIIKCGKNIIESEILEFKSQESILRKFVSAESKTKQESAAYFEGVLESIIYDEYVAE